MICGDCGKNPARRGCTRCDKPICDDCSIIFGEKPATSTAPANCGRCDYYGHEPTTLMELEA